MTRLLLVPLVALTLAGCAAKPPEASGSYRALNPGRWHATAEDLYGIRTPLPSTKSNTSEARP
jgi:hypothetical protein